MDRDWNSVNKKRCRLYFIEVEMQPIAACLDLGTAEMSSSVMVTDC